MHYGLIVYFAKCQSGMTVTLLLALAQDFAADPAEEPAHCSVRAKVQ